MTITRRIFAVRLAAALAAAAYDDDAVELLIPAAGAIAAEVVVVVWPWFSLVATADVVALMSTLTEVDVDPVEILLLLVLSDGLTSATVTLMISKKTRATRKSWIKLWIKCHNARITLRRNATWLGPMAICTISEAGMLSIALVGVISFRFLALAHSNNLLVYGVYYFLFTQN